MKVSSSLGFLVLQGVEHLNLDISRKLTIKYSQPKIYLTLVKEMRRRTDLKMSHNQ